MEMHRAISARRFHGVAFFRFRDLKISAVVFAWKKSTARERVQDGTAVTARYVHPAAGFAVLIPFDGYAMSGILGADADG
jgi:hypothetical protein